MVMYGGTVRRELIGFWLEMMLGGNDGVVLGLLEGDDEWSTAGL